MSFLEKLENIDQEILLAVNGAHNPFLDQLMFYVSEKWVFIPVYLLLIYFLQKFYGWKITGFVILGALAMIAVCDLTATYLFKNMFMRYRPSHHLDLKDQLHIVNGYRGGQFGFYSSHAANMTALSLFIGYFLKPKLRYYSGIAFTLVLMVCISRIYLGVHYPSDVMAGTFAGTIYAFLFIFLFKNYIHPKINFQI